MRYTQRYLIATNCVEPFLTEWFDPENNFNAEAEMIVYDLQNHKYTTDGKTWHDIQSDHL